MRDRVLILLLPCLFTAACASDPARTKSPSSPSASSDTFTFTDTDNSTYDALLRFPRRDWNFHTVLLLGGGTVTDMHWTVPATVEYQEQSIPLTTTGRPTRDADTIADALLDAGFAVAQYSSIHHGDVAAVDNPALATYVPYPKSRAIAQGALDALRARPDVDTGKIILLGHSLGAARALQIAATDTGPRPTALVLLSGAYTSRLGSQPSLAANDTIEALATIDLDASTGIRRHAWNARRARLPEPLAAIPFDTIDRDEDEILRRWEIAAAVILAHLNEGDTSDLTEEPELAGAPFPADTLRERFIPALAVYGGLDTMTVHAPLVALDAERNVQRRIDSVSVVILAGLGHNLGPEAPRDNPDLAAVAGPNLVGPIDPAVPDLIARWLTRLIAKMGG